MHKKYGWSQDGYQGAFFLGAFPFTSTPFVYLDIGWYSKFPGISGKFFIQGKAGGAFFFLREPKRILKHLLSSTPPPPPSKNNEKTIWINPKQLLLPAPWPSSDRLQAHLGSLFRASGSGEACGVTHRGKRWRIFSVFGNNGGPCYVLLKNAGRKRLTGVD